jgi:hypothetical protein
MKRIDEFSPIMLLNDTILLETRLRVLRLCPTQPYGILARGTAFLEVN